MVNIDAVTKTAQLSGMVPCLCAGEVDFSCRPDALSLRTHIDSRVYVDDIYQLVLVIKACLYRITQWLLVGHHGLCLAGKGSAGKKPSQQIVKVVSREQNRNQKVMGKPTPSSLGA